MNRKELMAGRFVGSVIVANGDRRKMSATLREAFTPEEREELSQLAYQMLNAIDKNKEKS